jgi:uncharacterized protein
VRDQLEALEELSQTDLAFRQIDVELAEVRTQLSDLRSNVDKIRDLLGREREQLTEAEKLRVSHHSDLEAIAEKTARSKKRQEVARNAKESEATQRELEVLKREKEERTAEAARLAQVVEEVTTNIGRHEGEFSELASMLEAEEVASETRADELRTRKATMEAERAKVSGRIRADLLRLYMMVFTRRGSAVAELNGTVCRGCHVSLPPQLFNQILRVDKAYQCPSCQRFLMPPRSAFSR